MARELDSFIKKVQQPKAGKNVDAVQGFVKECIAFGLMPPKADYSAIKIAEESLVNTKMNGYQPEYDLIFSEIPKSVVKEPIKSILLCHEILKALHFNLNPHTYNVRKKKAIEEYGDEEEKLVITGTVSSGGYPVELSVLEPDRYNENKMCKSLEPMLCGSDEKLLASEEQEKDFILKDNTPVLA